MHGFTPPKVVKIKQSRSIMILFENHTSSSAGISNYCLTGQQNFFLHISFKLIEVTLYHYQICIPLCFHGICLFPD